MERDLGLSSSDYSLALSIFFVVSSKFLECPPLEIVSLRCVAQGYLLAEVPSNMLLARSRPSIFLPALMFTWVSPPLFARERLSTHWY
jgi:hypothetical protein